MKQPKKILVAPLGWGLGHATRCIPVIWELQKQNAEVLLASDGRALKLLQQAFPNLESFELPAYDVQYRSTSMAWNIAWQLPKIIKAIWLEHRAIQRLSIDHHVDGIISDNRFGCFFSKKRCVFLTHQVNILVPFFLFRMGVNFFNRLIINQFDECWIPDLASNPNLSGQLSHPLPPCLKKKVRHIGALSRMWAVTGTEKYTAIAVLSGPEPQRTQFERLLISQATSLSGHLLIVQGKPEQQRASPSASPNNITVVPSMPTEKLNQAILDSGVYIGRSGYSTVMDLARLGKPALLVPTPGQTEQEYLGEKFFRENIFFVQKQGELNLEAGILEAEKRAGLQENFFDEKALSAAVASFLEAC